MATLAIRTENIHTQQDLCSRNEAVEGESDNSLIRVNTEVRSGTSLVIFFSLNAEFYTEVML